MRWALPATTSPDGAGPRVAGSTGSTATSTPVWPGRAATAPSLSTRLICPSLVEKAPSRDPLAVSSTVKRVDAGGLLPAASSWGGLTQREGVGGARPATNGRLAT